MVSEKEEEFLFILDYILNQISDNSFTKCKGIINELLPKLKNVFEEPGNTETALVMFSSLKMLLKLYGKLYSRTEKTSHLSVGLVFQSLKCILDDDINCHFANHSLKQKLLQIVSLLCKIAVKHDSEEEYQEVTKFCNYCIHSLDVDNNSENFDKILKLKILCACLEVFSSDSEIGSKNLSKLKSMIDVKHKFLANIVLHGSDDVAFQILLFLLPQYISFIQKDEIVKIIWQEITNYSGSGLSNEINYRRIFMILLNLFDFCYDKSELRCNVYLLFLSDAYYWDLIQFGLCEKDQVVKKQAMDLFKKSINLCNDGEINVVKPDSSKEKNCRPIFLWDCTMKTELYNMYTEIVIILEFLDEQQVHIIKPIFEKIEKIFPKILSLSENSIDFSWIFVIYQKAVMHESTQVVKWGLISLLNLPDCFFADEFIIKKVVSNLVPSLNNLSIYYNDEMSISKALAIFFKKMSVLETGPTFFCLFVEKLCKLSWSPEALFFVTKALATTEEFHFWSEKEVFQLKDFVGKAFKTYNKTISIGIQYQLLSAILKLLDGNTVNLESFILLLDNFFDSQCLVVDTHIWNKTVAWLKSNYSENEMEQLLAKYKNSELPNGFNEKSFSNVLIFFSYAFESEVDKSKNIIYKTVSEMLSTFYLSDRRLYCDELLLDRSFAVVCHILEKSCLCSKCKKLKLVDLITVFLLDMICYIESKLRVFSNLSDFYSCNFYSKALDSFLKHMIQCSNNCNLKLHIFYERLIDILESEFDLPPIKIYFVMKLLNVMHKQNFNFKFEFELFPKTNLLFRYLVRKVNEPLKKDIDFSEETSDLQVLWGKMNSDYLKAKWEILFNCFDIYKNLNDVLEGEDLERMKDEELLKTCCEALDVGGYGVLCPVMNFLRHLIPKSGSVLEITKLIDTLWMQIMERRRTQNFRALVKSFVEMLFQEEVFIKSESLKDKIFEYSNLIFMDPSISVVKIFVEHIEKMKITEILKKNNETMESFLCQVIGKALIFGPVLQKDERLTAEVCSYVEQLNIFSDSSLCLESRPALKVTTANEIRAIAIKIICVISNEILYTNFLKSLILTLIDLEEESTKSKVRYFGDSHVHRVKHRVAQALLILSNYFYSCHFHDEEALEILKDWAYCKLMKDNPQPSVKYLQEWLLINNYCINSRYLKFWDCLNDSVEKKTKGLCSLISIAHHLVQQIYINYLDLSKCKDWFEQCLVHLLAFSMDQHFEVRLYSQVVLQAVLDRIKSEEPTQFINCVKLSLGKNLRRNCKGNAGKNYNKLKNDFYFNVFKPDRCSLEVVYWDLPRIANVGSDEWISPELFYSCGVYSLKVPVEDNYLKSIEVTKWLVEKPHQGLYLENDDTYLVTENYQKKMIPSKPFPGEWDEAKHENENLNKDGLIVVASLIDRIPNLGGLARTCEIFGASEYVLNSLKYVEDKQFTSLSVTAEKWISIKEVKLQNLKNYLLEMKEMGYTVVGAEQALHSQPLNTVKLPKKSLLLLGNEKEGIPPNLLPLLDICVEIPQLGIIRSLNVHVTGALIIWEYAKQNNFSSSECKI